MQNGPCEKKIVNPWWQPRNGCDGKLMAKILIMCFTQSSSELSLLKFLPSTYHHSHFLAATFDFTTFFPLLFWMATPFYSQDVFVQISLLFANPQASLGHDIYIYIYMYMYHFHTSDQRVKPVHISYIALVLEC